MDHKYVQLGKFAPSTYGHPSTTGPRTLPKVQNTIPQLAKFTPQKNDDLIEGKPLECCSAMLLSSLTFQDSDNSLDRDDISSQDSQDSYEDASERSIAGLRSRFTDKTTEESTDGGSAPHTITNRSPPESESSYATEPPTPRSLLHSLHSGRIEGDVHTTEVLDDDLLDVVDAKEFIFVAQIFADQFVNYELLSSSELYPPKVNTRNLASSYHDSVSDVMNSLFPRSIRCTLENCAFVGEEHKANAPTTRPAARPMIKKQDSTKGFQENETRASHSIFSIPVPSVRVRRGGVSMDVSSTALRFWEELGLSPFLGPKDVIAFCIYPDTLMLRRGASLFLDSMSQTYLSFRLGSHSSGHSTLQDYPFGLVPTTLPQPINRNYFADLRSACEKLGRSLVSLTSVQWLTFFKEGPWPLWLLLARPLQSIW